MSPSPSNNNNNTSNNTSNCNTNNNLLSPQLKSPNNRRRSQGVGEISLDLTYNRYNEQLAIANVVLKSVNIDLPQTQDV